MGGGCKGKGKVGGWGKSRDKGRGGGIDQVRVRMKMRRVRSGSTKNSQDKGINLGREGAYSHGKENSSAKEP